jgi:PAS domain S-box-containing protein
MTETQDSRLPGTRCDAAIHHLVARAVDSATEMISITDADNRFIFVNKAFLEGYGYTEEEILGQRPSILRLPEENGTIGAEISHMTREGGYDGELFNVRKDGTLMPVHLSTSVIRDGTGSIAGLIGVARNIEQKRQAEEALRTAERRFQHLFEEISSERRADRVSPPPAEELMTGLADGINKLVEKMRNNLRHAMSFSSFASHELRAPLAILRAQLEEALSARATQDDLRVAVMSAYNEILRLARVTNNLINLSAMQAGVYEPNLSSVQFRDFCEKFCHTAKMLARERDVQLEISGEQGITIELDADLFRQVLVNLFDNALKHVSKGGRIEIAYRAQQERLALRISDNGPGIRPEDLPKIFDTFYRGNAANKEARGAGLGLSMAKWIVQIHGGTIDVESEVGKGTTFAISVPLRQQSSSSRSTKIGKSVPPSQTLPA